MSRANLRNLGEIGKIYFLASIKIKFAIFPFFKNDILIKIFLIS
jgi:hypothetical protein